MVFTQNEKVRLNEMISVALLTGKIPFDEISESLHKKITDELAREEVQIEELLKEEKGV